MIDIVLALGYVEYVPSIFEYLDYRAFLKDWFAARKAADARYSHRRFARRAGVSSPSLLSEVVAGRRNLTTRTEEGFLRALGLDHDGARFFSALVAYDQAATVDERNAAWQRVSASRRFRAARPIADGLVRYLSCWYLPAVRELAHCEGFRADPAWIARTLHPRITEAQARDALETLTSLGLLEADASGRLRPRDVSLVTPHEVAGLAGHNYHQAMLSRAGEALSTVDYRERHFCGVTVAIPQALLPELKAELDAFQERMLELCDERVDEAGQVFQLSLQLFPLSEGVP